MRVTRRPDLAWAAAQHQSPPSEISKGGFKHSSWLRRSDQHGLSVLLRHLGQRNRLVVAGVAGLAEFLHPLGHDFLHRFARGFEIVARIELLRSFRENLSDRAR